MAFEMHIEMELHLSPLLRAPGETLDRATRKAAKAGAEEYTELVLDYIGAGRAFGRGTGQLEQSISWRPVRDGVAEVSANAEHAPFVEYGTKAHVIRPKAGRSALKIPMPGGGYILRSKVNHPGSKAYPFFYADRTHRKALVLAAMSEVVLREVKG